MQNATILLVEDEPAIRRMVAKTLEGTGYRVLQASNGAEALWFFERGADNIDLLLTDMKLPLVSGQDVIHQVRQRQPTVKILVITAYPLNAPTEPEYRFLQKPFSRDELLAEIRAALGA